MRNFIILALLFISSLAHAKDIVKEWDCEKLVAKAADQKFVLNHLAAMYANRQCKGFTFDYKELTDLEKKVFKAKFEELDENKKADATKDTETIDSLKLAYTKAKEPTEKFEAFKKLRQKYRTSNKKDESFKLIKKYHTEITKIIQKELKSKKPQTAYYDVYIDLTQIYSKALWSDNQLDKAIQQLQKAIELVGTKKPIYNLNYLIGKINEDQKNFDLAIKNYDAALTDYKTAKEKKLALDKSFDAARVEWSKAWIQYRTDDPNKAASSLKLIADNTTDVSEKSRALFFLAKVYKKLNKSDEAKKILEENIENDFFSFYSLASYYELGQSLPAIEKFTSPKTFNFDASLGFLSKTDKEFFMALSENEEVEIADRTATAFAKNNTDYVNLGLTLAEKNQFFLPLFLGFARLNSLEKKDIFAKHGRLLFPEVHVDKVTEMSKKTNIEKSLIYSIMKQESSFNPDSRSHADAMGLMQVIPRLAKSLAKKYKIESFKKAEDLFNPMTNIELGTYELKDQVEKQSGQLSFVASAYNAGPNALKAWRAKEPIQDMFEFIENIPYDETRTYVKIIARNMLFYQRLAQPDKEHSFPTEFVKIIN